MREFHLWKSVISKPEVITSFGAYIDVCYKIENYEVTQLIACPSVDDIQSSLLNK